MDGIRTLLCCSILLLQYRSCLAHSISSDQSSLLAFKSRISMNKNISENWNSSTPVCTWIGVTCGSRHERVTSLNVSYLDLSGRIPPELGNLPFLVSLDLGNNSFRGSLPEELSMLRRLEFLSCSNNQLTGAIPTWLRFLPNLKSLLLDNNRFSGGLSRIILSNLSGLESLKLDYNKLEGSIPEEIGFLRNLKTLTLSNNGFSGSIPVGIFNMSSLEIVDLSYNAFSGELPADLCSGVSKMGYISMYTNQINGLLPSSLGKCSQLHTLILEDNLFVGPVPKEIGNLTMLKTLYLGGNRFRGEIPEEIGTLPGLEYLTLDEIGLTGTIPSFIFNISTLQGLYLFKNNLTGTLPKDICSKLPVIQGLYLSVNQISGVIPPGIGNCTTLVDLYLDTNSFTGEIPAEIGNLLNVERLVISPNSFRGQIPESILNISTIVVVQLRAGNLVGSLPPTMGARLPNLEAVYLGQNNLSGTIPGSISNASRISHLSLVANKLTGPIPDSLGKLVNLDFLNLGENNFISMSKELSFINSLTNCRRLRVLWIQNNSFDAYISSSIGNLSIEQIDLTFSGIIGIIPSEIGNLSNLVSLFMDGNELTGIIPNTINGMQELQELSLMTNQLRGKIPDNVCLLPQLGLFSLSNNKFNGLVPVCLGNVTSLRYLNLDCNDFSGSLPSNLGSLKDILSFNLSSNFFAGFIPPELGALKAVTLINLARNELSGSIPGTFEGLQNLINLSLSHNRLNGLIPKSFGKLISLEILDLSYNNLSGEIPISMEALVHLKFLNLSFNSLHGEIPSEGPFAHFTYQSFLSNDALCGASPLLQDMKCQKQSTHGVKFKTVLIIVFVSGGVVFLASICAFIFIRRRKATQNPTTMNEIPGIPLDRIAYHKLVKATNGFSESNLIGRGGYGSVYKAILADGTHLAVKVFNLQMEGAFKSFDTECEVLRNLRHRNLTKVISSCSNPDLRAIVLEYMPNGSLEKWLHSENCLDLLQRLSIMIDVANALEYLHHGYPTPVIHCDLKPSNVLLDEDMVAHVCDFGIAKLICGDDSITHTKTFATLGYIAPEYGTDGLVSTRCDVYSYGIVLLETFTGKTPKGDELSGGEWSLREWVKESFPSSVEAVIDKRLLKGEESSFSEITVPCVTLILRVALNCSTEVASERLSIKDALASLEKIRVEMKKQ